MTFSGWVRRDDAGAVAVIVAICSVLLLGVAALAVDIGREYEVRRQSQSAADLAALAGALYLPRQPALACQAALRNLKDNTPSGQAPGDVDDPSACDVTTGNTADGQITITNDSTVLKVTTPTKIVQFGLAAAIGFRQGATGATATAAIRSVGDVLPYAFAASGGAPGINCVKVGTPPKTCSGPSDGNFDFLIFPRSDGSNSPWIDRNTAFGVEADALPTYFAAAKTYYATHLTADLQCNDPQLLDMSTKPNTVAATSGAVTLQPPYKSLTPGETCANTETGNKPDDVTAGLITLNRCQGKLASNTAAGPVIDNCNIVIDNFGSYLTTGGIGAGVDTTNCTAAQLPGSLSGSVLDDQRFGIVPEVTSKPTTGSSDYAIIGFLGVYIGTLYDNNSGDPMLNGSNGKVGAFDACVFPLDSITDSGGGSPLSEFLGSGPTVPVLIK